MCNSFALCVIDELAAAVRAVSGDGQAQVPSGIHAEGVAFPGAFAPVLMAARQGGDGARGREGMGAPAAALEPEPARLFPVEVRELGFGWPVEWKRETLFNARLDSLLAGKAPWGDALAARRCVLPCQAFFESHRSEKAASPRTGKPVKRRYRFTAAAGGPLLLAAVWEGEAFSVVTTDPNAAMAPIHDRMPLVLTCEEARRWLDPGTPVEQLAALADRSAIALDAVAEGRKMPEVDQPELPF